MSLPNFIDTERVHRYVVGAGQRVDTETIAMHGRIHGSWDASFLNKLGTRLVAVHTRRFLADCKTTLCWHAASMGETFMRSRAISYIYLFASPDESVMGRCFTVQAQSGPTFLSDLTNTTHAVVYVTLVDSRLTSDRLSDVVLEALGSSSTRAKFADVSAIRTQIHQSLANVIHSWPWDIAPALPDMMAMMQAYAPRPIKRLGPGTVSIAGGTTVIASVDSQTARRCLLEDSVLTVIDIDESDTSALSRACDRAAAKGAMQPSRVVLVAQQVGSDYAFSEETTDTTSRLLLSGVPLAQIAVMAHSIYEDAFGECGEPELLLALTDDEAMLRCEQRRCEHVEAFSVMVRVLGQDKFIKRIKERVWRPGGSLAKQLFQK